MSEFQETADRVSYKLQQLYESMDEHEQGLLERILRSAQEVDTSEIASPGAKEVQKDRVLVQTPVKVAVGRKPVEFPLLVLHW